MTGARSTSRSGCRKRHGGRGDEAAEVKRLEKRLARAGVDSRRSSTNTKLRQEIVAYRNKLQTLETKIDKLLSSHSRLAKTSYGSRSEQLVNPSMGRKYGQQPGALGHGRTPHPGLPEQTERHDPSESGRKCDRCGKPYRANGNRVSRLIEIEVKAHTRRIERTRWRRSCDCAASPQAKTAPPSARGLDRTLPHYASAH